MPPRSKIKANPFPWLMEGDKMVLSKKQVQTLKWWEPQSPHRDKSMVMLDGSIRSSKTIMGISSFVDWSLDTFKNKNFILAGKSMGALRRNVVEELFKILASKGIPYDDIGGENPHIKVGTNRYYLFGASTEKSQDTLQGLTAAGAFLDEAALMPMSFINQAIGRCSVAGRKIWFNCNPHGPKHPLKVDFIDKADEMNMLRLHFTLDDNPSLDEEVKEGYRRMFKGVFYQRYILGLWVLAEGVVYADHYNPDVHRIPHSEIEKMIEEGAFREYIAGTDFGYTHPMTGLIYGVTYDDKYYQVAEFYKTQQKTEALGQWYLDCEEKLKRKIKVIFCDSAEPDRIVMLKDMGLNAVAVPSKEIMAGINSVMDVFLEDRLFLSDECKSTDDELQLYRFPTEDDTEAVQRKDLPLDDNNHAMDAKRYCIHSYELYLIGQDAKRKKEEARREVRKRKAIR